MKHRRERGAEVLIVALLLLGAAAISVGVAMIFLPAGIIVAGMLAMAAGVVMTRGDETS